MNQFSQIYLIPFYDGEEPNPSPSFETESENSSPTLSIQNDDSSSSDSTHNDDSSSSNSTQNDDSSSNGHNFQVWEIVLTCIGCFIAGVVLLGIILFVYFKSSRNSNGWNEIQEN